MADQSDVEAALAGVVGGALYPDGVGAGCVVPASMVRVYRGWPVSAALDADLAAGRINVSISAAAWPSVNTTRWTDEVTDTPTRTAVLGVFASGNEVTFSGSAALGQVASVIADSRSAAYRTRVGDTLASVAGALATVLGAAADGPSLSLPGVRTLVARVEADQPVLRLTRRQRQAFRVTCWCPDPQTRDAVGAAIDGALSARDFLGLADGTSGRLLAVSSSASDRWEDAVLYRRELVYAVEYATTIASTLPRMAVGVSHVSPDGVRGAVRLS